MRILIELPQLIEDTILLTPAIENLLKHYKDAEFTFVGTQVTAKLFSKDTRIKTLITNENSKSLFALLSLIRVARKVKEQDLVISFKEDFTSKFFLFFVSSKNKVFYKEENQNIHKVQKYNNFLNKVIKNDYKAGDLMLRFKPQWYKKPTFGIHPSSVFSGSKRWDAKEFAKVAIKLSSKYDIILFGGKSEIDIVLDIEEELKANGIKNYENLAGKTTLPDLVEKIAALDMFLTIDSGPMQIAAVYRVNSIIIPSSYSKIEQVCQWKNPLENIVYKEEDEFCDIDEEHQDCMPTAQDVFKALNLA